ncbi:MAG TPA: hypothetical protein VJY15_09705 [Candidatus Acidoferrum sp.]|nr:hypothetical protein [Candidatus Acidoferrum sp.]
MASAILCMMHCAFFILLLLLLLVYLLVPAVTRVQQYWPWSRSTVLSRKIAILIAIFLEANFVATAQSISEGRRTEFSQTASADHLNESQKPSSPALLTPLKPQTLEAPYHPITPRQSLRWFITNTTGPAYLAGGIFFAATGTAVDRPKDYGPHWGGFVDRYGMRKTVVVTGNAIEASAGHILREDPRYFGVPGRPVKTRVVNVARLTFAARHDDGSFGPAYARTIAVFASNFLSNAWRAHSEANAQGALLRASGGFAGRMAANAFEEFWPDIKRLVFRERH